MARVLLIDDDEEHRVLARRILEGAGHQVDEAADGAMGLKSFGRRRPDVVLTDIDMPRLGGHEVIAALRTANVGVPVIAISGARGIDKDELLLKAAKLGAVEVITKPFEFRQLVGAVSRALAK
jgi:CheY-like chemotaxis protein